MLENPDKDLYVVAFIDDHEYTWDKLVEGFRVYPGGSRLAESLAALSADVLLVSSAKVSASRVAEIRMTCASLGIDATRVVVSLDIPFEEDSGSASPDESPRAGSSGSGGRRRVSFRQ